MSTPRIEINLGKIAHNAKTLKELYGSKGVDVIGVTKVVCGDPIIADVLIKSGISILADSRIANIRRMRNAGTQTQFLLLRTPILSQAEAVVKYTDISLNSELSVVKRLSKFAVEYNATHKIILMVDLGDLREGLMPSDLDNTVKEVVGLEGIELAGIGTNLACLGGIKPNDEKMRYLSSIARDIEEKFGLTLEFVSGGNSANYSWFMSTKDVGRINNLRLGESIYLGCEILYRKPIPGLFTDAFTLATEVIESKIKPSVPYGEVCQNAFGEKPKFAEIGNINRIIIGIGKQDVDTKAITPRINAKIIGASSDHLILHSQNHIEVGSEIEFDINYSALLRLSTSSYVKKVFI
jgi:ornithine racemase